MQTSNIVTKLAYFVVVAVLGFAFINSTGCKPKPTTDVSQMTIAELEKVGQQGSALAQRAVGLRYLFGSDSKTNFTEAFKWLQLAANQNDVPAKFYLATCYEHGYGVNSNLVEAASWYRQAATNGYAAAQAKLGECYARGRGVDQDLREAYKWLWFSALQNNADGQLGLGLMNLGSGEPYGSVEAYKWFSIASSNNPKTGEIGFEMLKRRGITLTVDQVKTAQLAAIDFIRTNPAASASKN